MKKKQKVIKWRGIAILNAYGEPWTKKVFGSVAEAEQYMELFWGNMKNPPDMSKHQVVPCEIKINL